VVDPIYFANYGVNNIKQLTKDRKEDLFALKFSIISHTTCVSDIGESTKTLITATIGKTIAPKQSVKKAFSGVSAGKDIKSNAVARNLVSQAWAIAKQEESK